MEMMEDRGISVVLLDQVSVSLFRFQETNIEKRVDNFVDAVLQFFKIEMFFLKFEKNNFCNFVLIFEYIILGRNFYLLLKVRNNTKKVLYFCRYIFLQILTILVIQYSTRYMQYSWFLILSIQQYCFLIVISIEVEIYQLHTTLITQ